MTAKKSKEEIQQLKDNWRADPCWDIEDTEGFEAHFDELVAYRAEWEEKWEAQAMAELRTFANVVGLSDNLKLAEHLRYLSERILKLETTLERE